MIKCGNCQGQHGSVEQVRTCHGNSGKFNELVDLPTPDARDDELVASVRTMTPATDRQIAFIHSLVKERVRPNGADDEIIRKLEAGETISKKSASDLIITLTQQPHCASKGAAVEGVHLVDGEYIKVQRAIHGSGRLYAKRMVDTDGRPEWEYAGRGPLTLVDESTLLTEEQAAHFGHLYGQCVFCGRGLTDERSIEVGYGPVCAEAQGLPWG